MRVRISDQADGDMVAIWRVIGADNVRAADRMIDVLIAATDMLSLMPAGAPMRSNVRRGIRMHPVPPYLILYIQRETTVDIIRVIHGSREWAKVLRDEPDETYSNDSAISEPN